MVEVALTGSDALLSGTLVGALEDRIARLCGRRRAIGVGSGTDALYFALAALDVKPGDEVLAPDVSFIATAGAIARTGARPVFVDIDATGGLDLEKAARRVSERTRAMVYAHLFGSMGDPAKVEAFAAVHGLHLIEDAAQAFGARYAGRPAGSMGVISALSFDPMKVVSAPTTAGAVLTDDDALAARVRRLRYHGREQGACVEVGYNSQLSTIAAAVLAAKLDHHPAWTERRRDIARAYDAGLRSLPLALPQPDPAVEHVWHKFHLRTPRRDELAGRLAEMGVPTKVHYPRALHQEPLFSHENQDEDFPLACAYARETLSLPIHAHLSDAEVDRVIRSVVAALD
jgi:dTDP-4-amino-4,6-dideoxygalactose transaminase